MLELACWGVASPHELSWVTPPPESAWRSGQALLVQLGILDEQHRLTPLGSRCAQWPVEPRIAVMLERAAEFNAVPLACGLAALLERIGQLIEPGKFRLANGKTATLPLNDPLAHQSFLVAAVLNSAAGDQVRIIAGEQLPLASLLSLYPGISLWQPRVTWSQEQGRLIGEEVQAHANLIIAKRPLANLPEETVKEALLDALRQQPRRLFGKKHQQLLGRMALLRANLGEQWPDWSEQVLLATLESWLAPYLMHCL